MADEAEERLVLDWSVTDSKALLAQLQLQLKKGDSMAFNRRIVRVDWDKIVVGTHSSADCRAQWTRLVGKVRTYRLLREVLQDVESWVDSPASSQLNEHENVDFPKRPRSAYFIYQADNYPKLRARHPDLKMTELATKIKKRWDKLAEDKKAVVVAAAQAEKDEYAAGKADFYKNHPEYEKAPKAKKGEGNGRKRTKTETKDAGPALPKTPFDRYIEGRISQDETEGSEKEQKDALRAKWNSLSSKRKAKYIEKALEDEKRYQDELEDFSSLNPDFVVKKHMPRVTKADLAVLSEAYGRPKMPPGNNGYSLFCHEWCQAETLKDGGLDGKSWMSQCTAAWKTLETTEQTEYNDRMKATWEEYRSACDEYLVNVPKERKEEERKILKLDTSPHLTNGTGKKKRRTGDQGQGRSKKQRTKATEAPLPPPPSGRKFFMLEQYDTFKKRHAGLDDGKLKSLMSQAFDKLSQEKKQVFESRAEQFARMAG